MLRETRLVLPLYNVIPAKLYSHNGGLTSHLACIVQKDHRQYSFSRLSDGIKRKREAWKYTPDEVI